LAAGGGQPWEQNAAERALQVTGTAFPVSHGIKTLQTTRPGPLHLENAKGAIPEKLKQIGSALLVGLRVLPLIGFVWGLLWLRFSGSLPFTEDRNLKEARDTAKLLLYLLRNEDGGSAYGLLSKDYRERLPSEERGSKKINVLVVGGQRLTESKLGAGKLSDNKQRATFEGSVRAKDGQEHSFRLLLVKDGSSWRVDLFTVQR
jgi:hypothetical protein